MRFGFEFSVEMQFVGRKQKIDWNEKEIVRSAGGENREEMGAD
jgi:hypothetical protein